MERKLASIQKIVSISPIENADKLERCQVLGWSVVVGKGQFKVDDLIVYCEVDSFLPCRSEFEFLRSRCYKKMVTGEEGFRIKTVRLRGQISQGIVFPLDILKGCKYENDIRENLQYEFVEGMDVSGLLGITKYEIGTPVSCSGDCFGRRPEFVPKTDEERIQSNPALLREFEGKEVYIGVKIDGASCSIFYNKDWERPFGICGRNFELKPSDNAYWLASRKYDLENKLKAYGKNIVLQGEVAAPGIQKNRLNLKEVDFFLFDVVFTDEGSRYATFEEFKQVAKDLGLKTVPLIKPFMFENQTVQSLLELSKGKYEGTENNREGIVIRPLTVCHSETLGGRLSCKVINNEYLLKEEE